MRSLETADDLLRTPRRPAWYEAWSASLAQGGDHDAHRDQRASKSDILYRHIALAATFHVLAAAAAVQAEAGSLDLGSGARVLRQLDEHGAEVSIIAASSGALLIGDADADPSRPAPVVSHPPAEEPVIVELEGRPILARPGVRTAGGMRRGSSAVATAERELRARQQRVTQAIVQVAERGRGRSLVRSAVIAREFIVAFNGVVAMLTPSEQAEVAALPEVVAVHPDSEVHTTLDVSVPLVGAPTFWSDTSYRGAGMTIAIIDTGIDYTHADLGGCFGVGCKVVGGYDLYNDDADPIDDNGHGTHVASTAAGTNPTLTGVAPDASLLAYKIFPASGSTSASLIIAAIEHAIDPNGDDDTSDRPDVINMSLGGPGNADDPVSQATDNASAAGSLVVVSAGNAGRGGFFTVNGHPASARTALTVAATDDADDLAEFSSKGPTADFEIKPEIAAPGVGICAARAGGTTFGTSCFDAAHASSNGTSMSSPHVAGAGALLRGVYPSLGPLDVKSMLVNNASDVGLTAMEVGGGRLDVPAARVAESILDPTVVSFGFDDPALSTYLASRTLTVSNVSDVTATSQSLTYDLSATGLPAGAQLDITPDNFTLAAGDSIVVDLDLTVDNSMVPTLPAPHAYEGAIVVDSGVQLQRVPFAFFRTAVLHLDFDMEPASVLVHDGNDIVGFVDVSGVLDHEFFLSPGSYDVVAWFPNEGERIRPLFVVHENVAVVDRTVLAVNSTDAVHVVSHLLEDSGGHVLDPIDERHLVLHHPGSGVVITIHDFGLGGFPLEPTPRDGFATNTVDSDYRFHLMLGEVKNEDLYVGLREAVAGVGGPIDLGVAGGDYDSFDVRYAPRSGEEPPNWLGTAAWLRLGNIASSLTSFYPTAVVARNLFVTPLPSRPFPWAIELEIVQDTTSTGAAPYTRLSATHPLQPALPPAAGLDVLAGAYSINPGIQTNFGQVIHHIDNGQVPLNLGPFFWQAASGNNTLGVFLRDRLLRPAYGFYSQGNGIPESDPGEYGMTTWELFFGGSSVDTGQLVQNTEKVGSWKDADTVVTGFGQHVVRAQSPPYAVGATNGINSVELVFDNTVPPSGPYDPDSPFMMSLQISDSVTGTVTNQLDPGAAFMVTVEVRDQALSDAAGTATGVADVSMTYVSGSGSQTLPAIHVGGDRYEAQFTCDSGLGDLTIIATDVVGNTQRQDLEPAIDCTAPVCGNLQIERGEACDDGGESSTCDLDCSAVVCGDGFRNSFTEHCDDSGESATCNSNCTPSFCGDGVVNTTAGEQCDDGPAGSATCNSDCTFKGVCGDGIVRPAEGEECDDGNDEWGDCCSPTCQIPTCKAEGKASFLVRIGSEAVKNSLKFKWVRGAETLVSDFGDPLNSSAYTLCVLDTTDNVHEVRTRLGIPPGSFWSTAGSSGFKYKDRDILADGVQKMKLKAGPAGKAHVSLAAKGPNLPAPVPASPDLLFEQSPFVTVILINDAGVCWRTDFQQPAFRNDPSQFKEKVR